MSLLACLLLCPSDNPSVPPLPLEMAFELWVEGEEGVDVHPRLDFGAVARLRGSY